MTGADYRVRSDIPNGFEYSLAEIGLRLDQRVLNRLVLGLNAVAFRRRRDDPFLDRRACHLASYGESAAVWQARRVTGRDCLHRERRMLLITQVAA